MHDIIQILLKGIITGILSGYLLMYGLRPAVAYPDFILEPFEHKWIFIILFIINYYLLLWDMNVGILMLLSLIALIVDMVIFTNNGFQKIHTSVKKYDNSMFNTEKPRFSNNIKNKNNSQENDDNYSIIEELKQIITKNNNTDYKDYPQPFIL